MLPPSSGDLYLSGVLVDSITNIFYGEIPSLEYRPPENWTGQDSFIWRGFDGADTSDPMYVYITVTDVNDDPVAVDDFGTGAE